MPTEYMLKYRENLGGCVATTSTGKKKKKKGRWPVLLLCIVEGATSVLDRHCLYRSVELPA